MSAAGRSSGMPPARVLLVAEAANPEWVSVPLVGWSICNAIRARTDAHIVTQVRNREALLRAGLREGDDFTAIDSEGVARRVHRVATFLRGGEGRSWTVATGLSSLSYAWFEHLLWRRFAGRLRAGKFDLVHRVTPTSPALPSSMARRCHGLGVPFVIGPLNGGLPWPAPFRSEQRREREWLSSLRGLHRLLPGYRGTRRHASAILVGSRRAWSEVPARWRDKCVHLPENGFDADQAVVRRARTATLPIRVIAVGRLVPLKGMDMLVEAIAPFVRDGRMTLDIVGEGDERSRLESLIRSTGCSQGIRLVGQLAHEQVLERLAVADLFALPSIREFGGGAVLEAMAAGLPAVVVDYGGPPELVAADTGFLVPLGSRAQIVGGLTEVFRRAAAAPELLDQLGARARHRATALFTWDRKACQIEQVYDWVLGRRAVKPSFGFLEPCGPP